MKFCNELDLKEVDTLAAGQRCVWCQAPADQLCQSGLIFCGVECRAESLNHGFRNTYLAALDTEARITTFSCGRFQIPIRNWPWIACDRLALYHRRHELLESMLSAGLSKKSMIVMAAASCGMLVATFCVDDVRERRIVTETAANAVVRLLHHCSDVHDRENEHDKATESTMFIVAGVVKSGRNAWRLHADSVVFMQFKRPTDDALAVRAIADSTELELVRNASDGRLDVCNASVHSESDDFYLDTTRIAADTLLQEAGGELPADSSLRLARSGKEIHMGRNLFTTRRVV